MNTVFISTVTVLSMLAYAVPGFLLIKSGLIKKDSISAIAVVLMYVAQPCLMMYSFQTVTYTHALARQLIVFFLIIFFLLIGMIALFCLIFRKKFDDIRYRIFAVSSCMTNCAFMGVPLVKALLPDYPEAIAFTNAFAIAMNLLGWTVVSAIITRDKKYISLKKVIFNPAMLSFFVALPLFVFKIRLPDTLYGMVELLGGLTTPLCMLIMGMRLATMKMKPIFTNARQYAIVAVNQLIMPLIALGIAHILSLDVNMTMSLYIICACPVASVVLNYAELLGEGQETAANMLLLGTLSCVVTIPLMMTLI